MKLNGEIIQVIKEGWMVSVTININRAYKPTEPDAVHYSSEEEYGQAMEDYDKQMEKYLEHIKAIESLGIRNATIEFGMEE